MEFQAYSPKRKSSVYVEKGGGRPSLLATGGKNTSPEGRGVRKDVIRGKGEKPDLSALSETKVLLVEVGGGRQWKTGKDKG